MSVQKVLDAAKAEVGYKEGKNNDNKFAKIAGHANHQPWCATFIRACFIKGKEEKAIPNSAYCPHFESWAREHNAIVPITESKKGDLLLFDFNRIGRAGHIEIQTHDFNPKTPAVVKTIGGNTGAFSQDNGDGVAKKVRSVSDVRVVIRPKWSK